MANKIIIVLISALLAYVGFTVISNKVNMNTIVNNGLSIVQNEFDAEPLALGEFETIKMYKILPFKSKAYYVEDLGVMPILAMNAGIMQIITININPYEKDLPQLTIDFTIKLNQREIFVEIYELMLNKEDEKYKNFLKKIEEITEKYKDIKDAKIEQSWYLDYTSKAIKKECYISSEKKMLNFYEEVIEAYIEYAKDAPKLSDSDKKNKVNAIKDFSEKLVEKGGISTDVFKKTLGEEKTLEYFEKVLYGYAHVK